MGNFVKALWNYKKELQLSWYTNNTDAELKTYDNLGIINYYLGNIDKASFYHDRMMGKKLEGETPEKALNNNLMKKYNNDTHYKKLTLVKSIKEL